MARLAAVTALAALVLGAGLTAAGGAQAYPRLHIIALAQRADRTSVAPGGVFHLTIHVKIAQARDRLDELILGSFDNCEIISNETVRTTLPSGTDFVERLTLQALAPGEATISPAYIDAIDPAIGRPMRFSSNAIRVRVVGGLPFTGGGSGLVEKLGRLVMAAAIGFGCVAAVFVLGVLFVRGRKRRPVAAPPVVVTPVVTPVAAAAGTSNERLRRAAAAYGAERSAANVLALREVLFELAGAARGATLVDALRALGGRDGALRGALLAAERAAFGPAGERAVAGDELLTAVQAYAAGSAASEGAWTR